MASKHRTDPLVIFHVGYRSLHICTKGMVHLWELLYCKNQLFQGPWKVLMRLNFDTLKVSSCLFDSTWSWWQNLFRLTACSSKFLKFTMRGIGIGSELIEGAAWIWYYIVFFMKTGLEMWEYNVILVIRRNIIKMCCYCSSICIPSGSLFNTNLLGIRKSDNLYGDLATLSCTVNT